jgi:glycosyltransferase involved in cell wall biosynthesis
MQDEALVDVLIPVYNGVRYVRSAVESMQMQTVSDIRIHIVDDGSTDGTAEVLAEMAAQDPRLRIHSKANGGIVDALNTGLGFCTAQFVARHDADDIAYPDRLERQIAYLRANPDCVALSGAARHIDQDGRPVGSVGRVSPPDRADPYHAPAIEPYLIHPFLMVRLAGMKAVGGYRYVHHSEDTDLYWRLQDIGRLHNLDEMLGDYRMHDGSISGGSIENGRVMALSSQLSAISACRRRRNEDDLQFTRDSLADYKRRAGSLAALYEQGSTQLTPAEAAYLEIALGSKLLELAGYRPYEVDRSDCEFMRASAVRNLARLTPQNRSLLYRRYSGTAARLAHKGMTREAAALVWPALLPAVLYRYALRLIFPPSVRLAFKRVTGPVRERLRSQALRLRRRPG